MKNDLDLDGRGASVDPLEDPRLSAYVLGELSEDERRVLEAEMERRPELADEVRALGGVATSLRSALGDPVAPRLGEARRAEILSAAHPARASRRWVRRVAVAATVLLLGWVGVRAISVTQFGSDLKGHGYIGPGAGFSAPGPLETIRGWFASDEESASVSAPAAAASAPAEALNALGYGGAVAASTQGVPGDERLRALGYSREGGEDALESLKGLGYVGESTGGSSGSEGWFLGHGARRDRSEWQRARNQEAQGTESYDALPESRFRDPRRDPLSTFSIDVDTASYANVRRFLTQRQLPPAGAVRIEEMINYFSYAYPEPRDKTPFSVSVDSASCPWEPTHRLVRIGLKGRSPERGAPRTKNLVFLVDVSGSMDDPAKLPLVQKSLRLLVNELGGDDRVALVVYAGNSGLVLPATSVSQRARILDAIDNLSAGGSTNGGQGIQLAYATAQEHFATNGVNRVILATDGDFNVGITDRGELLRLIAEKAKSGVFLSVLGFGTGNLKDATMEQLADHGNGNYAYVDTLAEARKVLVREMGATLETIAKDVKIQVEFNPARVGAWRLVGYENRVLAARDFNDDKKDAGEIGAGHTVTALYEIAPAGAVTAGVDSLRYQTQEQPVFENKSSGSAELLTVKLRYKEPAADTSQLLSVPFTDGDQGFERAGEDLRFAAAVAAFGMCLRGSGLRGSATLAEVHRWAESAIGADPHGDRREFLKLVDVAAGLSGR